MKKLFATLILVGFISMPSLASANLLSNAGFDSPSQDPWWGMWGNSQHTGTYGDVGTGIGGSNSVKIVSNSAAGTGDDYYMYNNGLVSVTPGTTYYGAIYAKTASLVNEEVFSKIDWFNGSGGWVGTAGASSILTGTNDWTALQISGAAPSDAAYASLAFFMDQKVDGGTGTTYFDNAYLDSSPIPEPTSMLLLGSGLLGLFAFNRKRSLK